MKKTHVMMFATVMVLSLCGCTKEVENEAMTISVAGQEVEGVFTGTLEDDEATGEGEFKVHIDDTSYWVYKGEFSENEISGKGTIEGYPFTVAHDGKEIRGLYTGSMENGKISGEGTFVDVEEEITFEYSGNWLEGILSGEGYLTYDKYVVHFTDNDREGAYEGNVLDGLASGEGTFSAVNGEDISYTYTGLWENGLFQGEGVVKYDSEDYYGNMGTFTNGEFTPNELEFIQSLGTYPKIKFGVNDMSVSFIEEHTDFFVTEDSTVLEPFVDGELRYKQLIKSPSQYGDKLIKLSNYTVIQIWENEQWGKTLTTMLIRDSNYEEYYFVFYLGVAADIYEDSKITLYALPIDSSSYETTGGGTNNCYILYGCYIK